MTLAYPLDFRLAAWLMLLLLPGSLPALTLSGDIIQGGMAVGRVEPGSRVEVDGTPVRVSEQGVFLLGFDRDAPSKTRVRVFRDNNRVTERLLEIAARDYRIQRIEGLPQEKVTPPDRDWARIKREAALVEAARERDDPRTDFLPGFVWPVQGAITGVYGSQRILNGEPRRPHYGIDVAAPVGTEVVAPADGVVTLVHPDMFFSGGTLIIDHGHRLSTTFLHLNRIRVEEGDRVSQGEAVAEVGATGRVTGAHLDWRMNLGNARIDPALLVPPMPHGGGE